MKRRRQRPSSIPEPLKPLLLQQLLKCRTDPARFNDVILGRPSYWSRQIEICQSLIDYPITCVKTGNAVGKSYLAAGVLLWFATCHPGSKTVVAAPTSAQLEAVVWAELEVAYRKAEEGGCPLGGALSALRLDFGPGWGVEGWGQGSVESKSGRHAGKLFALVDEASGVKASVMEAIDSLKPTRRLYLGNPLRPEGKFYELCQNSADNPYVNVITIPSLESPDIELDESPRGMADRTWLEQNRYEYGEESLWWASHVLARFPDDLFQALLPILWLNAAASASRPEGDVGPRRLGVDVAKGEGGDAACLVVRDDAGVVFSEQSNRWSLETLAKRARLAAEAHRVAASRIVYDATGVGVDFGNRLAAEGLVGCRDFMGSRDGGEKFANLRSASAWALRRRLDPNRSKRADPAGTYQTQQPFQIPKHLVQQHRRELQECRYELDERGRIALETKDEFQARLKHSPNFLDALCMTFAFPYA